MREVSELAAGFAPKQYPSPNLHCALPETSAPFSNASDRTSPAWAKSVGQTPPAQAEAEIKQQTRINKFQS